LSIVTSGVSWSSAILDTLVRILRVSTLVPRELEQQAIAWRRHLHSHPELSFEEVETSRFVEETLRSFDGLELDRPAPTAVVARLQGGRPGKVLALRADMDALPIQEETGLDFASTRPGVMHACGHDCHTAMLLGVAKLLLTKRDELAGEVRFVFQHAEEKPPGGARQLVDAGVMDGVDLVVGAHVAAIKDVGKVGCRPGPIAAAADTFSAEIRGRGGHAAAPHKTVDPVVVAAQVVTNLQQLVSRSVDPLKSAVVSVTRLHAGTADNIVPEAVELGGTVRSFDPAVRESVRAGMERIFKGITEAHGATHTLDYRDGYAAVINDETAAELVEAAARAELGEEAIMEAEPIMGGEDFSAYLEKAPGAFFWVGAGSEDAIPHHHPRFTIDEAAFAPGIAVFARTALDYLS
jgi:amidohydrolase